MSGHARAKATSFGERRSRRAGSGETASLIDTGELLWKSLGPSAGDGGIVVDEDVWAVVDRHTIEDRLDQHEGFAVLIARRVRQLVIGTGELPVQKPE